MKITNLGKVSVVPRGEYSPGNTYEPLDIITYEGSSYLVCQTCTGVTPQNGEVYHLLAAKGAKGDTGDKGKDGVDGITFNPAGEFNPDTLYHINDVVQYDGSSYLVKREISGLIPYDGEEYMLLVMKGDKGDRGEAGDVSAAVEVADAAKALSNQAISDAAAAQASADTKLPLSGGEMSGILNMTEFPVCFGSTKNRLLKMGSDYNTIRIKGVSTSHPEVDLNPVRVNGIDTPVSDLDAVNKGYVDSCISHVLDTNTTEMYGITLYADSWVDNRQEVTIVGISPDNETQLIQAVPKLDSIQPFYSFNVHITEQDSDTVVFMCDSTPDKDISVFVTVTKVKLTSSNESSILGLQVDYRNGTFTRLMGARGLNAGDDFDQFSIYGGRRRCNVADDGMITAWYGDDNFAEDGSNGQVMVYQPKFYYRVTPLVTEPIVGGMGYHLRKVNYYISDQPLNGFKLHPVFYDANGRELEYYLDSAYEGSIFDASADAYLTRDEQVMDTAADKFSSIAGVKPASGKSQILSRTNVEKLAQNRGSGWHSDFMKPLSARQILMIVELGTMNVQNAIGNGVVSIEEDTSYLTAALTGSTSALGNKTGQAAETVIFSPNGETTETANGKTAVSWRGTENPWGNAWKIVNGVNVWGDGTTGGGQPYICTDFDFAESRNSGNYEGAGFSTANKNGRISAMGYSEKYDWLFIASETLGDSSGPVGDYFYTVPNLDDYAIVRQGGRWIDGVSAGIFSVYVSKAASTYHTGTTCARMVHIPSKENDIHDLVVESWKQQMEISHNG